MAEFEDGQRVRYVGREGLYSDLKGRVGVVTESFRLFDEQRISVLFEGEDTASHYDVDDFEAFKETYEIENSAEDSTYTTLELTDPEAALMQRVIDGLNEGKREFAPTLTMKKEKK